MPVTKKVTAKPVKTVEPPPLNIHQRLHACMKDVSYVVKEEKKVNNQYRFVSHDAVTAVCRAAFVDHGIISIPSVHDCVHEGNRCVMTMDVAFINIDEPGDRVVVRYVGYGIDTQDKGPGKAISYCVKYAYLKVLGLETGDDPERDNIPYVADADKPTEGVRTVPDKDVEPTAKGKALELVREMSGAEGDGLAKPCRDLLKLFGVVPTEGKPLTENAWILFAEWLQSRIDEGATYLSLTTASV